MEINKRKIGKGY